MQIPGLTAVVQAASRRHRAHALGALVLLALAGCASLLPRGHSEETSPFRSFEAARDALERVEPYRTTVEEMKALGFDTHASTNVREIPFPQLVSHLVQTPFLPLADLDPGIQECIAVRHRCRAYQFHFSRIARQRTGAFALDILNFKRITQTSGWRFEGTVLVRDDNIVLFRNHGGEPKLESTEVEGNPLGPLQSLDGLLKY